MKRIRKIIIASDHMPTLGFFRQNIAEDDCQLISTQLRGRELLTLVDNELPDLLILDVGKHDQTVDLSTVKEVKGYNPN